MWPTICHPLVGGNLQFPKHIHLPTGPNMCPRPNVVSEVGVVVNDVAEVNIDSEVGSIF